MSRADLRKLAVAVATVVVGGALAGCAAAGSGAPVTTPAADAPSDSTSAPAGASSRPASGSPAPTAWLQYVGGAAVEIRALGDDGRCPEAIVDGRPQTLAVRAPAAGTEFPQPMCSTRLPDGARRAQVRGQDLAELPAPGTAIQRIVVVGDAGCRVESGKKTQQCNNPDKWPAAQVASAMAAAEPDLIVHVGDYYYRESPCPADEQAACGGDPSGPTQATMTADFFSPFAPALAAAPWIMVRGNHEMCGRGSALWFRYLDVAAPRQGECPEYTDPFAVDVGDQRVVVVDDSAADDTTAKGSQVATYAAQMAAAGQLVRGGPNNSSWLALHRPVWAAKPTDGKTVTLNATMEQAVDRGDPGLAGVEALLSGHIHALGSFGFADLPPQLVSGGGGASLVGEDGEYSGLSIGGLTTTQGAIRRDFGFVLLTRKGDGWEVSFRSPSGAQLATCSLVAGTFGCA